MLPSALEDRPGLATAWLLVTWTGAAAAAAVALTASGRRDSRPASSGGLVLCAYGAPEEGVGVAAGAGGLLLLLLPR